MTRHLPFDVKSQLFSHPDARRNFAWHYAVIGALLTLCYLLLFVFQARIDIQMESKHPQPTFFKVYWAGPGQAFSEKRMAFTQVDATHSDYFLYIDSLKNIDRIRIDPLEYAGQAKLKSMRISQFAYHPLEFNEVADYAPYRSNPQIQLAPLESGLQIKTLGQDGHFEISLEAQKQWRFPLQHSLNISGILLGLLLIMTCLNPFLAGLRFVPLLLLIAGGLALTMAMTTGLGQHPDEVVHLAAVKYYAGHLFPPALNSPEIASTYSIYGHSRLSDYQIYYQLAGYFQAIPALFNASAVFGARVFGLLVLGLLLLFSVIQPAFRSFALPLLISAQTWYLFAYTNSEAVALSLTLFVAYLVAVPESSLNRFLQADRPAAYTLKLLGFGLVFGALLLLKINYYFFILFLVLYLLWRLGQGDLPNRARLFNRLFLLVLIALTVYGIRFALDIRANGWDSADLKAEMQEQHATTAFKPSTELGSKYPMLLLRDRGYSAGYALDHARWFEKSFQSAFGVYGFSDFYASQSWYDLVRYLALALLLTLTLSAISGWRRAYHWLLLIVVLCAGGLIAASAWHSWTAVFQPQGRYLLPILPMLGILYYHLRQHASQKLMEWLSILLFLLAAHSFIYTGLGNLGSLST